MLPREQLTAVDLERLIVGRVNATSRNNPITGIAIERGGRDGSHANWHAGPYFHDGPYSDTLDAVVIGIVMEIEKQYDLFA